jgi:hypothetical protein
MPLAAMLLLLAPRPVATIAFTDVSLLPMDQPDLLQHQTVIVTDRRIVAIGPVNSTQVPKGAVNQLLGTSSPKGPLITVESV